MRRAESGFTLAEVMIVSVLIGLFASLGIPKMRLAVDQTRVDQCAGTLKSIWSAQRCHWLEWRQYASDFGELQGSVGLRTPGQSDRFTYQLTASAERFVVSAKRADGFWFGSLSIDESGAVTGWFMDSEGNRVEPSP